VIPKYASTKFADTSAAAQVTTKKAQIIRVKNEIKFLFKKKERLNQELYNAHLKAAQEWGSVWYTILESIHSSLNSEMEKKYKSLDMKIKKLVQTQTNRPMIDKQFYLKLVNNTNISFSEDELKLLNKRLKYNLNQKRKQLGLRSRDSYNVTSHA
jgi:hypothetical protein